MSDDLCIECNRDMARYCQSCMASHISLNRELVKALEAGLPWVDSEEWKYGVKNLLRRAKEVK